MGNIDIGDMFHNFLLHEEVQPVAGIDLTPFFPKELAQRKNIRLLWERWARAAMGLKNSPYSAILGVLFMDEIIRGDPGDPRNIFQWDYIRLNLPGHPDYKPDLAWVCKMRRGNEELACDFVMYVDDTCTCGNSKEEAQQVSHRVANIMNWLGIQEAARKRRDPCQDPGPWAGSVVHISPDGVISVSVIKERWEKTKSIISWIDHAMSEGETIEFKTLERYRGYLVYVSRMYPVLVPYLKGVHLTLDSWRPWRKEDGWKMTMAEIRVAKEDSQAEEDSGGIGETGSSRAPARVKWVARLEHDVKALKLFLSEEEPPKRVFRPKPGCTVVYTFADASGSGFGSSIWRESMITHYSGQWTDEMAANSSNFRELSNLINTLEQAHSDGELDNTEVFIFTDNTTVESAFYNGTSSSPKLLELILRLQRIHMHGRIVLHFVHVAGKRMMTQGTDGLSRGTMGEGALGGQDFLSYAPLHMGALEREAEALREWIVSWLCVDHQIAWLTPEGWFRHELHADGSVWSPAPAAAEAALEQLAKVTHKQPQLTHLVLIPRLMTATWRKMLAKICDIVFMVPVGSRMWPDSQFEPLIVGLCLPLIKHSPWKLKGTHLMVGLERELRSLPPSDYGRSRIVLREYLRLSQSLDGMPTSMVRQVLQTP
jgi:hypothetical protein